ncbi:hypothetical protein AJ80_00446 [Polytolypa hystricis UAMH7299]|uniref:Uncharacterized protein n=1 Tax=Polytolypa hystricis (strain UAMH7299) TaxID=1447883 RepID=A0A2B7Z1T4_POLH7|nr:hypothetical protein AJ80_00446 [Polytolypa hystricis UAMH7299]
MYPLVLPRVCLVGRVRRLRSNLDDFRETRRTRKSPTLVSEVSATGRRAPTRTPSEKSSTYFATRARSAIDRIDAVLAGPIGESSGCLQSNEKRKPIKSVRFADDVSSREVDRWIVPALHQHRQPLGLLGKLQGWEVKPLEEPEEDGEDCKYVEYWGSFNNPQLACNHYHGDCPRCPGWNELSRIYRSLIRKAGFTEHDNQYIPKARAFAIWNDEREKKRRTGRWCP